MTDLGSFRALNPPRDFGGRTVREVLDAEHRELDRLLAALSLGESAPDRRRAVATVLTAALSRHFSAEEQDLFPAARSALPDGPRITDAAITANAETLRELVALASADPGRPEFDRIVDRIAECLRHHVHTLSAGMLPRLDRYLSKDKQVRLGNRIAMDTEAAPTRPHTWTPSTPPWNRIVDPAIGAIDKLRDVAIRRKVYPQDL